MLPILMRAAAAAAKQGAKRTATKAASRAGTRRPTGDTATNARKRFYRSAERYMKEADKTSGATAERNRFLARQELTNALNTYDPSTTQKFSKPIQSLAARLGVNLEEERERMKTDAKRQKARRLELIGTEEQEAAKTGPSFRSLVSSRRDPEKLRQEEARSIMNGPIGQRILGGLVNIWRDEAFVEEEGPKGKRKTLDRSKIYPALFKHFKVDNLADLLDKIEEMTGETLYKHPKDEEWYESAKLTIAKIMKQDNSAVA